jgi:CIC family chloride channel protein
METGSKRDSDVSGALRLALAAGLVGLLSGLVAAGFRIALVRAEGMRAHFLGWAHAQAFGGFALAVTAVAMLAWVAAWLVRRFAPHAGGSGIPHVEAVVNGELPPAPLRLLPIKFVGGWLAIGSGLALGREGPSVQMGASIGALMGKVFRTRKEDTTALLAAGAGAGLATAFNAPVAGAVFVLEELVRRFDPRVALAALGASAAAMTVARVFFGPGPDFAVRPIAPPVLGSSGMFVLLGLLAGVAGVAYTRAILGALQLADRWRGAGARWRAAVIGASVGVVAWFAPDWVGGGDNLTQATLSNAMIMGVIPFLFVFRFAFGAVCYAAGTPGGLFAPMLVLGAQVGLLFTAVCPARVQLGTPATAYSLVGMAAFFTAVVGSPLTGILLVMELSGAFSLLLPMLFACAAAMVVASLYRSRPIYDVLKERTLALDKTLSQTPALAEPRNQARSLITEA